MAVLGNLRKNSFVLIAVIGMALFAFVIAGVLMEVDSSLKNQLVK